MACMMSSIHPDCTLAVVVVVVDVENAVAMGRAAIDAASVAFAAFERVVADEFVAIFADASVVDVWAQEGMAVAVVAVVVVVAEGHSRASKLEVAHGPFALLSEELHTTALGNILENSWQFLEIQFLVVVVVVVAVVAVAAESVPVQE